MKRLLVGALLVALLSGAGAGAKAQPAGSRAQVFTLPVSGEAGRFQIPQVKLPEAAVARRINRQLLAYVTGQFSAIDPQASPQRQLYQAARACCYDEDLRRWSAVGTGFTGTEYRVLLNQGFLLSVAFADENGGLLQPGAHHLTFDLRTGRRLALTDLVADPPAQLRHRLEAAVSRRLRNELATVAANYGDFDTIDQVAQLYGISAPWHMTPARGRAEGAGAEEITLQEFALTPRAVLLFYTVGMSRLEFEFLPDDAYTFPFDRLQPRPILRALLRPDKQRK